MKQIKIGTFPLGHENVDLYALPNDRGGEFYTMPDRISSPRIKVGTANRDWDSVVSVLIHEATELALARCGVRFDPCGDMSRGSDRYQFFFNHNQFSEVCVAVAQFICPSMPLLAKVWREGKKK